MKLETMDMKSPNSKNAIYPIVKKGTNGIAFFI